MNYNELLNKCQASNKNYEEVVNYGCRMIGVEIGKHVYYWFKEYNTGGNVFFDHAYSTNTGKTKTWKNSAAYNTASNFLGE